MTGADAQDFGAQRARLVAEVEAMYAETRAETGLAAMSSAVRAALGQTISQPYIVAISADLIAPEPHHVVLEVGTGSGYQAAILAEIVQRVFTIEIVESLGRSAEQGLKALGYRNIEVRIGDGYRGWPEKAPFDGIVVTAAAPRVPQALVDQLRPGGRMVIPVGENWEVQQLLVVTKGADGKVTQRNVLPVRFVPLVPGR